MEILSPASNLEHIKVAIDEKANAVYGGLKKWNARNKAINFTTEEYNYLIDELHKNGIKFYLTLNILMLDEEISEVIKFLKNNKLPDAFIVTDVGLINELYKEFPQVPLHFSTQFGIHNLDDIDFIKTLNGERAILSRELTLEELNKIKVNTDIETECFIWGSQCLSFSGLCFFGTLINGGGGNRGKCIITCRDIYSIDNKKGNYLYVPDMDCINLISKLDGIDCLKLEGRRRNPKEIKQILNQINNGIKSKRNAGYLFGVNVKNNGLYEDINSRTKPFMKAMELENINNDDVCVLYKDDKPIEFSTDYMNENVMYIFTELKKPYIINKKNLCIDLQISDKNVVQEILYMNYKGDGNTFYGEEKNLVEFDLDKFIYNIEKMNSSINIYKIKYKRYNSKEILINKNTYKELFDYIINDCKINNTDISSNDLVISEMYLETKNENVIEKFIDDPFIKIIYDIETVNKLKEIQKIVDKYSDRIIYKLPLFNWKSEKLDEYIKLLENKEIMFTRFSQIYLCKSMRFKKKLIDYTVYVWNKKTLKYLIDNGIEEFTLSPELSYERNKLIFNDISNQAIIAGRLPLVYTRNCFGHLFGCKNCINNQSKLKEIKNEDKNLDFEIYCNDDYRYILNREPILNDYSKVKLASTTKFRYVVSNETINDLNIYIECFKQKNYYNNLKKYSYWKNSYECNILEGKE